MLPTENEAIGTDRGDSSRDNPLLDFDTLPRFDRIEARHVTPAIERLIAEGRAAVEQVACNPAPATWDNVAEALEAPMDRLDRAWHAVHHLNAVVSTPALRDAYHENLPKVTAFHTDVAQDLRLFERFGALAASPSFGSLDAPRRRVIENELRDFRLGGAELSPDDKARFKAAEAELAELSARFDDNLLDATDAWSLHIDDPAELDGVPQEVLAECRAAAQAGGRAGFKLTLRMPCYAPVMSYCRNRALRETLHRAYATRASELGAAPDWDNTPIVARILELRREVAELLGYASYADVSLVAKMADSVEQVLGFLRDLAAKARPFAERDYAELVDYARGTLGLAALAPWDIAYASERLKASRYAFSEQDVRQYFPEHKVLEGLFGVAQTLYGIAIRESSAPSWHSGVRFFDIVEAAGEPVGHLYLDSYARADKQGGAWMDEAINRRRVGSEVQLPVAFLTCNLSPPLEGRPATYTHEEVTTLFHEFGHGLHQLLTRVDVAGVSGIQGVEWDAAELPSQFMENYCWEWAVLSRMTAHVDTGETLPRALYDRMIAARNFQSGLAMLRHLELAVFDMLVHSAYDPRDPAGPRTPQAVLDAVRREIAIVPRPDYDRFIQSFAHVFAGGYAAGYYSYKWAEVLSADAFSAFEETGVLSPVTGARFRDEVLARGGSRDALESFVAFRGRPPQLDALLRHNGLLTHA